METEIINTLLFENGILVAIAAFIVWMLRNNSKTHETLFTKFFQQHSQFQAELPKIRMALEGLSELSSLVGTLEHHIISSDEKHLRVVTAHNDIVMEHLKKIDDLEQELNELRDDLKQTKEDLMQAQASLQTCEVLRTLVSNYLADKDENFAKVLEESLSEHNI